MIIDSHCHVWPDHIAAQIRQTRPVGLPPLFDGTVTGLRATMDEAGIDLALCLGVANAARTVARTNEFIGSVDRTRFVPFGTIHPELSPVDNLRYLRDNGIFGVKLHPLFQRLALDDPRVITIATALAEQEIPVITHVGSGGDAEANRRGSPAALAVLLRNVPKLRVIACHFGGYHCLDEAEDEIVGSRAVLETSWPPRLDELDGDRVAAVIRRHGADRVVFGSDWPMARPAVEMNTIRSIGLTEAEQRAVLGDNLARLLGLAAPGEGGR